MNIKIKYFLLSLGLGLLLFPAAVNAQEDQTNPQRLELEKRISERKAKIKIELNAAEKSRLQNRCAGAQTKVTVLAGRAKIHSENRDKKTSELIERITKIIDKQKTAGQDVSKIETALSKISEQDQAVQTAYTNYATALADSAKIDCKTDPLGFKTSLEDARTSFNALQEARKKLRETIKQELQPALREFHATKHKSQ